MLSPHSGLNITFSDKIDFSLDHIIIKMVAGLRPIVACRRGISHHRSNRSGLELLLECKSRNATFYQISQFSGTFYRLVESQHIDEQQKFHMHVCILCIGMLSCNSNLAGMFLPIMRTYSMNKHISNNLTEYHEVQSHGIINPVTWWVTFTRNECQLDKTGTGRNELIILFIPRGVEETPPLLSSTLKLSEHNSQDPCWLQRFSSVKSYI